MIYKHLIKIFVILILINFLPLTAQKKDFGFVDAMKFKNISNPSITNSGEWVIYISQPDRGDGAAHVVSTETDSEYIIDRGSKYQFSENGHYVAFSVLPPAIDSENADKDKPKNSLAILNTITGQIDNIEKVDQFKLANNGKWVAYKAAVDKKPESEKFKKKEVGTELILRHLESGTETQIPHVTEYMFDSTARFIFYVKSDPNGIKDGLYYRNLEMPYFPEFTIQADSTSHYSNLSWNKRNRILAFTSADLKDDGNYKDLALYLFNPQSNNIKLVVSADAFKEWYIPKANELKWTDDGDRLFFGIKPETERYLTDKEEIKFTKESFYNIDSIRQKTDLYYWHWDDPLITTQERTEWEKKKDRTYAAVYHLKDNKYVKLGDINLPKVQIVENPDFTIAYNDLPYLKEITWAGWFEDLYLLNLKTGENKKITERLEQSAQISPFGGFVVYFKDKNWQLYNTNDGSSINLTENVDYPFWDQEWDIPANSPGYGIAGWGEFDDYLFIYDQYDVWRFSTRDGSAINITAAEGRANEITFRAIDLDPDKRWYTISDTLFMYAYHNQEKWRGLATATLNIFGVANVDFEKAYTKVYDKAKYANKILISKEKYDMFPDLKVINKSLKMLDTVSYLQTQLREYKWGNAELISWTNSKGDTLQGVVIKPADFKEGKKYPVLTYFYEQFTQRMYHFPTPSINHRPSYPIYVSDGYVIFLPDIKYYEGSPGESSLDALLTGNQKLIDMGIADPKALGIQGHSWAGYQSAYIVTQTDMFAACVSGAPVGNMTSAYSGIRLESGLARQFQYEMFQSRIGGNLWDSLDSYIRNSPVFYARNMNTPLLIMFGDIDEAVPWQQGVELYLALRRLEKPVYFLQYENEPHHPRKYENKLDYAYKMKQFFDHYLKGKPAPKWVTQPIPFRGQYQITE